MLVVNSCKTYAYLITFNKINKSPQDGVLYSQKVNKQLTDSCQNSFFSYLKINNTLATKSLATKYRLTYYRKIDQ